MRSSPMVKMHKRRKAVAELHRKFSNDLSARLATSTNEVWARAEQQQPTQQPQGKLKADNHEDEQS